MQFEKLVVVFALAHILASGPITHIFESVANVLLQHCTSRVQDEHSHCLHRFLLGLPGLLQWPRGSPSPRAESVQSCEVGFSLGGTLGDTFSRPFSGTKRWKKGTWRPINARLRRQRSLPSSETPKETEAKTKNTIWVIFIVISSGFLLFSCLQVENHL